MTGNKAMRDGAEHSHLWNDLPYAERERLMPFMTQSHIRHLEGARAVMVRGHEAQLREIDGHIKNLRTALKTEVAHAHRALRSGEK